MPTRLLLVILVSFALAACGGDDGSGSSGGSGGGGGGSVSVDGPSRRDASRDFFTDETRARGIDFTQNVGWSNKHFMPEQLGSGGAYFDYDGDGDRDLFLMNAGPLPGWSTALENALYANDGKGRFKRVPGAAGLAAGGDYGVGCAVADVDLDGDLDVYISNWGRDKLYLNDGKGNFTDCTEKCGIDNPLWGASAAFADVNGDGWVDLYVTNYVDWDINTHEECFQRDVPIYCGPQPFKGLKDCLFINQGGGVFKDMTDELMKPVPAGKGLGAVFADYDHDGDLDLYVANDQTPNFLYRNDGKGNFEDVADFTGVAVSKDAVPEAGMGVAFADFDNDLHEDILVTNFEDQVNSVYRNEGDGFFLEVSFETGVGFESRPMLGWGIGLVDVDHDGWKDLYYGNGHVYDNAHLISPEGSWEQKNRLHLNDRKGGFAEANAVGGAALEHKAVTRGVLFGDFDDDGDVDIAALNIEGVPNVLFNNGADGNWLMVATAHPEARTPILGARIVIRHGDRSQTNTVQGGYSYLTHNDTRVHFGLGEATGIDSLEVTWPGGKKETYGAMPANRVIVLTPGEGAAVTKLRSRVTEKTVKPE